MYMMQILEKSVMLINNTDQFRFLFTFNLEFEQIILQTGTKIPLRWQILEFCQNKCTPACTIRKEMHVHSNQRLLIIFNSIYGLSNLIKIWIGSRFDPVSWITWCFVWFKCNGSSRYISFIIYQYFGIYCENMFEKISDVRSKGATTRSNIRH